MIKRLFAFFLSFVLVFLSVPSFAADPNDYRKPNQWQRERTINDAINKSSVTVEASKTYPVSTLDQNGKPIKQIRNAKSTIKLGASTANVGKSLMKRAPQIAIAQAVVAILGRTVDWVLDPENNRVKYKEVGAPPSGKAWLVTKGGRGYFSTPDAAAQDYCSSVGKPLESVTRSSDVVYSFRCPFYTGEVKLLDLPNPDDLPEWQYISADDLANKVIQQANSGQSPAIEVMSNAAIDAFESGLLDAQLDAASDIPQPDSEEITQEQYDNPDYPADGTTPDPEPEPEPEPEPDGTGNPIPDSSFELPDFCDWASKVCEFIDWYQEEPDNSDTEIDLPEPDTEDVDTDISFGGSCPDDFGFTADFRIFQFEFVLMPFSKFCPLLDTYIKPVLVILGSYMAVLIVGGRRDV